MADTAQTLPFSLNTLNELTPNQKLGGIVAIAMAIAVLVGVWTWSKNVEYNVLFSNISDRDGGQIVASLQQMNVPYKYTEGGGAILIPCVTSERRPYLPVDRVGAGVYPRNDLADAAGGNGFGVGLGFGRLDGCFM